VLDANVLVSAVIAQGPSHRIVTRWLEQGSFEVIVCPMLLPEVEDVLSRPRIQKTHCTRIGGAVLGHAGANGSCRRRS
jgi:predicted nucleic acid-binding protein